MPSFTLYKNYQSVCCFQINTKHTTLKVPKPFVDSCNQLQHEKPFLGGMLYFSMEVLCLYHGNNYDTCHSFPQEPTYSEYFIKCGKHDNESISKCENCLRCSLQQLYMRFKGIQSTMCSFSFIPRNLSCFCWRKPCNL